MNAFLRDLLAELRLGTHAVAFAGGALFSVLILIFGTWLHHLAAAALTVGGTR